MPSTTVRTSSRFAFSNECVSSDFVALASHMTDCQRSRGRFFMLHAALETLHAVTAPRIVTTGALCAVCTLALALMALA